MIIQGPGKYRTDDDEADKLDFVVEVVGKGEDGNWYGRGVCGPDSWDDNGVSLRWTHDYGNITGPYVEPPKPVLTIEEKARVDGWVVAWTVYDGPLGDGQCNGDLCVQARSTEAGNLMRNIDTISVLKDGPFLCRESDWPRVQELVAKVNAESRVQPAAE